jgi:putative PIN family toxin of toxin-antitoxin system
MRVVVDTNVFASALLSERSPPGDLVRMWREDRFTLLTAAPQLEELNRVTRYPNFTFCVHRAQPFYVQTS